MSTQLQNSLERIADRGEWHGAEELMTAALAEVDGTAPTRVVAEPTRSAPGYAVALAAGVAATVVIGAVALWASTLVLEGDVATTDTADQLTETTVPDALSSEEPIVASTEPQVVWERIDPRVSAPGGGVAIGDGRVVVSSNPGGHILWYSDDLEVWHAAELEGSSGSALISTIAHGPQGWVAGGSISNGTDVAFWYSEDATQWAQGTVNGVGDNSSGWNVRDMASGGPGWVAAGWQQRAGRIWVSEDGLTWDTIALPEFDKVLFHRVTVEDGVVTVIGRPQGSDQIDTPTTPDEDVVALRWQSIDGQTWTPLPFQAGLVGPETHTISTNPDTGARAALNKYGVWVSTDGSEWVQVAASNGIPPYTHPSQEVVWIGDTMIGGSRDFMYESSDGGTTWVRTGPADGWAYEYGHARRLYTFGDKAILLSLTDFLIGTLD